MNLNKSYKMVPIIIGLSGNSLSAKTEILFSESEIIKANYLQFAKSSIISEYSFNVTSQEFLKYRFNFHYQKWYSNTRLFSNPRMIIEDDNFKAILQMGETAVPLIIEKIEIEPSQLVWALNIITNKRISGNELLSINDSCKAWVKYSKQKS